MTGLGIVGGLHQPLDQEPAYRARDSPRSCRPRSSSRVSRRLRRHLAPEPPGESLAVGLPSAVRALRPSTPLATTHIVSSLPQARLKPSPSVSLIERRSYFELKKAALNTEN
jgi:hypothetical protein